MTNPVLDLKVIADKLNVYDSDPNGVLTLADELALLALLRETRAALQRVGGDAAHSCLICGHLGDAHRTDCWLAAVLAKAGDEP